MSARPGAGENSRQFEQRSPKSGFVVGGAVMRTPAGGNGATQNQGMDVVRALVGVDRLEVQHVAHDVEFFRYAVAAVHVARGAGDVEGLAAVVALDE